MQLTVGFDLDLTLIDSRPGVHASMTQLSAELGVFIDPEVVVSRLGPPLEAELAEWMPAADVPAAADRYREIMAATGAVNCSALPGAIDAVRVIRDSGGRVVVVTAKSAPLAAISLDAAGIEVDAIHGWLWSEGKGTALREEGASVYVGDHPHDVLGARFAGALSVGVRTGGTTPDDADVLLDDLTSFPDWYAEHLLDVRLEALSTQLRELGSVLVAFSGGADSAFLLAAAARALGPEAVVAATAVSPSLAGAELPAAVGFAASLGVRHVTPETDELARDGYVANDGNRCFHCKATLLDTLRPLADSLGLAHVATGTNADDAVAGFRPGIRAAAERGAVTPLLDAGLTKAQVRAASRRWGLATADKPALACLASRIAYGVQVTPSRLARVDRAETALRAHLGDVVTDLRVRDLGDGAARIELDERALDTCDGQALDVVRAEGFATVTTAIYRTGSLNDALT
ncbi:MAG: pyridinium-3,5-biscarboxylic acid mononucleotide sulfurtransferase [Actinomycetota bacterium]|nr:pyridinium-3,5-biscarboxylic acid mononucleotide sulfurtransferase [Actinomycetota bacterium]